MVVLREPMNDLIEELDYLNAVDSVPSLRGL